MGAFGIFVAILTFIYVVYYAVIIVKDVAGDKQTKKDTVEVFAVGNTPQEDYVEQPTYIKENEELPPSSGTSSNSEDKKEEPRLSFSEEDGETMASQIMREDTNELYKSAKEAEKEMVKVFAESDDEVTAEEYDDTRIAELIAQGEEEAERMSI